MMVRFATIYITMCQKTAVTLAPPRGRRYIHLIWGPRGMKMCPTGIFTRCIFLWQNRQDIFTKTRSGRYQVCAFRLQRINKLPVMALRLQIK